MGLMDWYEISDISHTPPQSPEETSVYRFYGHGELLYVGITNDVRRRFAQHTRRPFFEHVEHVVVNRYVDRFTAERVEAQAIDTERPIFNIQPGSTRARSMPFSSDLDLWRLEVDYFEIAIRWADATH